MKKMIYELTGACALAASVATQGEPTFAERLGWEAEDVVVMFHIDDVGMSHSSNLGAVEAMEYGVATSFSVMMTTPWVPEVGRIMQRHPEWDCGLHLTLTSEFDLYRWGPLSGKPSAPSLVDKEGSFWGSVREVVAHADPDEVEAEIRAQIDRAEAMGLPITHMDSHMGTLFASPEFFERYAKVGIEKQIPILAAGGHMTHALKENREAVRGLRQWAKKIWNGGLPIIDDVHASSYGWPPGEKLDRMIALLRSLKPGVTEIIVHATRPTDAFARISGSGQTRLADLEVLIDPRIKKEIDGLGIQLTTWKELMKRRKTVGKQW